jgi:hypothetical protein
LDQNLATFAGLTIFNDFDPGGLRFMNFSYELRVPEPSTLALFAVAFSMIAWLRRRKLTVVSSSALVARSKNTFSR